METVWTGIRWGIICMGGWLDWFFGGFDGLLYALAVFVAVDYATGLMRAVMEHSLSSTVGFRGIFRKMLIFCMVGLGHVLDAQVIGDGSVLRTMICFFYISNEGVSLLENAGSLGVPIPVKMKEVLEQLHTKGEGKKEA